MFRKVGGALEDRVIKWFDYLWQNKVGLQSALHLKSYTWNPTLEILQGLSERMLKIKCEQLDLYSTKIDFLGHF